MNQPIGFRIWVSVGFGVMLASCGGGRLRSAPLRVPVEEKPPLLLRELQGGPGTVPARLLVFQGERGARPGGVVGRLSWVDREVRFEVSPGGQAHRVELDRIQGSYPVYREGASPEGLLYSVFVDEAAVEVIRQPRREDPPRWVSPAVAFCSRYRFLGNERLTRPVICHPDAIFCVIPRPTEVPCDLDGAAQTICEGYVNSPFNPGGIHVKSIANHRFMLGEPRAFECIETRVGHPLSFELRDYRELKTLRVVLPEDVPPLDFNWDS